MSKKVKLMTLEKFKAKYGIPYTLQAMRYQCRVGNVDCTRPGHEWLLELTPKTLAFYNIEI